MFASCRRNNASFSSPIPMWSVILSPALPSHWNILSQNWTDLLSPFTDQLWSFFQWQITIGRWHSSFRLSAPTNAQYEIVWWWHQCTKWVRQTVSYEVGCSSPWQNNSYVRKEGQSNGACYLSLLSRKLLLSVFVVPNFFY